MAASRARASSCVSQLDQREGKLGNCPFCADVTSTRVNADAPTPVIPSARFGAVFVSRSVLSASACARKSGSRRSKGTRCNRARSSRVDAGRNSVAARTRSNRRVMV